MTNNVEFPEKEWLDISPLAKDFVKRLLNRRVDHRISAAQALMHPFLSISIHKTPPKPKNKPFSPEYMKKCQTQTHNLNKDFFSAHKMTLNVTNTDNESFRIMKLETSLDGKSIILKFVLYI